MKMIFEHRYKSAVFFLKRKPKPFIYENVQ